MLEILDTTLRDGTQQEGIAYSPEDKLNITEKLAELGLDYVEGGWPGSNPKDAEYFARVQELNLQDTEVAAFGSTRRADKYPEEDPNLKNLVDSDVDTAVIFGKAWDLHVRDALSVEREVNLDMIFSSVDFLNKSGMRVIFDAEHFFDGFSASRGYALEVAMTAAEAGADTLVLCDTNGGFLPEKISRIVQEVRKNVDIPLGIHAHNDGGLAVANSLAAIKAGVEHVQGTINGYGERCGNANLCSLLPTLQLKKGYSLIPKESLEKLTAAARYISEVGNLTPPTAAPYVGESAFAHKGGVHVNAVMKNPDTYEHVAPGEVGNRRRVLVSELSGRSNLRYKADELGIELEKKETEQILDRIKELEHRGYNFEGAEASFYLLVERFRGEHQPLFELDNIRIFTDKSASGQPLSEASIKLTVEGEKMHTAAEGVGPVNALDSALRKALSSFYPSLEDLYLVDYKVRVIDSSQGTAAAVRVLVKTSNGSKNWGTVGVSTNIIEASWQAVVDSVEYGIRLNRKEGIE